MKILARLGLSWDSKFFSSIRQSKRKKKRKKWKENYFQNTKRFIKNFDVHGKTLLQYSEEYKS